MPEAGEAAFNGGTKGVDEGEPETTGVMGGS